MTYHIWSDEWFEKHGDELYAAQKFIVNFVRRWSRCLLVTKEKYGTIRYAAIFPPYCGYYKRENWIDNILHLFGQKTLKYSFMGSDDLLVEREFKKWRFEWYTTWLCRTWAKVGKIIFKIALKIAIKKFPNVEREITADADWLL